MALAAVALAMLPATAGASGDRPQGTASSGEQPVTAGDRTAAELAAEEALYLAHQQARRDGRLEGAGTYPDASATGPLEPWTDVATVARRWSDRMVADARMWHNPDYAEQYGYWAGAGENIAFLGTSEEPSVEWARRAGARVARMWWDSEKHRQNWMHPGYDQFGLGVSIVRRFDPAYGRDMTYLYATANFRDRSTQPMDGPWCAFSATEPPQETTACGSGGSQQQHAEAERRPRFSDVPFDHPQHDDIIAVADAGVTQGCGGDRFCPAGAVSRAQMATFLMRALDLPPGDASFTDVPADHPHRAGISALVEAGITDGCAPDRFCPQLEVTRGQMAMFLYRALRLAPGERTFEDVPESFRDATSAMDAAGLDTGCDARRYCPGLPVSRAVMATYLARSGTV